MLTSTLISLWSAHGLFISENILCHSVQELMIQEGNMYTQFLIISKPTRLLIERVVLLTSIQIETSLLQPTTGLLIVFLEPNAPTGTVQQPDGTMGRYPENGTVPVKPGHMASVCNRSFFVICVCHWVSVHSARYTLF